MRIIRSICLLTITFFFLNTGNIYADDKPDCEKINNKTVVGNIKYMMCKRGSNKLDKDGNFKKGTFNPFKKIKKL